MAWTQEELKKYREDMDWRMEELGAILSDIGYDKERQMDYELVEAASRKLKTMYKMLLTTGIDEKLLKACMSE